MACRNLIRKFCTPSHMPYTAKLSLRLSAMLCMFRFAVGLPLNRRLTLYLLGILCSLTFSLFLSLSLSLPLSVHMEIHINVYACPYRLCSCVCLFGCVYIISAGMHANVSVCVCMHTHILYIHIYTYIYIYSTCTPLATCHPWAGKPNT